MTTTSTTETRTLAEIAWGEQYLCPHCDRTMTHDDLRDAADDYADGDGHYHTPCHFFFDTGIRVRLAK